MKRGLDLIVSLVGLLVAGPILALVAFLIFLEDRHSPLYWAKRVGKDGKEFYMLKLRSMFVDADKVGPSSTSAIDPRITRMGHIVRAWKLDEFAQLYNVLRGEMSLVGPRPNIQRDVATYTKFERKLLQARPGITDFASIVFSDENHILRDSKDPDRDYCRLIRPWKNRLAVFYVENSSVKLDLLLILLTVVTVLSRKTALRHVQAILSKLQAPSDLISISARNQELKPTPLPGSDLVFEAYTS